MRTATRETVECQIKVASEMGNGRKMRSISRGIVGITTIVLPIPNDVRTAIFQNTILFLFRLRPVHDELRFLVPQILPLLSSALYSFQEVQPRKSDPTDVTSMACHPIPSRPAPSIHFGFGLPCIGSNSVLSPSFLFLSPVLTRSASFSRQIKH